MPSSALHLLDCDRSISTLTREDDLTWASRWNRVRRSGSPANVSGRIFGLFEAMNLPDVGSEARVESAQMASLDKVDEDDESCT